MKKLSIFQTLLFGVFGLAAVIGIFVFATHTSNSGDSDVTVGTVIIWGTLPKASMQDVLIAVTKDDQSLKDVTYVEKSNGTLASDLASAIATGNAPDLVLASQEQLHSLAKLIMPIPTTALSISTFTSAFIGESALLLTPTQDGYYGVPFLVDPLVLFSNRAILSSEGIAKPPATWEALTGLVPNVAVLTPTKQITRGLIALGSYSNVHNARAILSSLFLQTRIPIVSSTNGSLAVNLSGTTGSSEETLPGRAVLNFYTQFADPSKVSYTWNGSLPDSQQAFITGDLALYLGYLSETKLLKAANPNLDFAVSPLPQPATATLKSAYGLLYSFMVPRGAKNPSGGFQAAGLLSSSEKQSVASSISGLAPATLSLLSTAPADPIALVGYAEALYAKGWLSPSPADTDAVFSSMITGVISGRLSLDAALNSATNALAALLQQ
jgi:ABC-type glycerol-3-phosphate transport system substrate-binding protein